MRGYAFVEGTVQTTFWELFISEEGLDVPVYLATLDPDNELTEGHKWRVASENVLHGVIVFEDSKEYFDGCVTSTDSVSSVVDVSE